MAASIAPVSSWSMPFVGPYGPSATIEVIKTTQHPEIAKVLTAWQRIYRDLPGYTLDDVFSYALSNLDTGRVLVTRDPDGVIQAFARVISYPGHLFLGELVVNPSNKKPSDASASRGIGTMMMYGVCRYAERIGVKNVFLCSTAEVCNFYKGLGMLPTGREFDGIEFSFDLSKGIPPTLIDRVQRYFPEIGPSYSPILAEKIPLPREIEET